MAINELTDKRYHGKICEKHPEFNGLRAKSTNLCIQCMTEKRNRAVPRGTQTEVGIVEHAIHRLKQQIDHNDAKHAKQKQLKLDQLKKWTEYHEKLISESV